MITVRKSSDRGHLDHGWLDTYHTFSFGDYHDPKWMGFGPLRVINEDVVAPGAGFPTHPHRDMEIVTYILSGALEHQDSLGSKGTIKPGEIQGMSAGRGIRHSEFNASKDTPVHLLQIWIEPKAKGLEPRYEQRWIAGHGAPGGLRLIASPDGKNGSMMIHQDAAIHAGLITRGERAAHEVGTGRRAWVQVARGSITLNGKTLNAGDGAGVTDEASLALEGVGEQSEVLLFDLP